MCLRVVAAVLPQVPDLRGHVSIVMFTCTCRVLQWTLTEARTLGRRLHMPPLHLLATSYPGCPRQACMHLAVMAT